MTSPLTLLFPFSHFSFVKPHARITTHIYFLGLAGVHGPIVSIQDGSLYFAFDKVEIGKVGMTARVEFLFVK
jgi:hypothetical protein